jgi:radical SAM superfamily enzyme YgiQ (UPF0313 family)
MKNILLIVYDNGSFVSPFPQGIAYIANSLEKNGHTVTIYNQDIDHSKDEDLTKYLDENKFDLVGVGVIAGYYQYKKLISISRAVNKSKNRNKFIYMLGGHGPAPEPEYFLKLTKSDVIVIGEGEETVVEIVNNISYDKIKGIAYIKNDKLYVNERRELIKDIDSLRPAYHLFPIEHYRLQRYVHTHSTDFVMPVLSGRGCVFNCSFCFRMDKGFRPRSNKAIIEEVKFLKDKYRINVIDFSDELLMSSVNRTISLCEALIDSKLNIRWHCNGRLNYAIPKVLKLMKKAGCIFINYGLEAIDNNVLKLMNKALTVDMITKGVEATLEEKISPGLNLMWGNPGDNLNTLDKAVNFLLKYDDCAQLRTLRFVTPYPGCPLYYKAIELGLLKDIKDFYEVKHKNSDLLTINFTDMDEETMYSSLYKANCKIIDNYYKKHAKYMKKQAEELYLKGDDSFRGFRQF